MTARGVQHQVTASGRLRLPLFWPESPARPDIRWLPFRAAELALVWLSSCTSDFRLLRDFLGIIDLNAEVSHGRLELGVSWKQLGRPKVLGAQLDRRCLCPAHRVRAVLGGVLGGVLGAVLGSVKAELFNPVPEDPRVLSGAQIR